MTQIDFCLFQSWFLYFKHLARIEKWKNSLFVYSIRLAILTVLEFFTADITERLAVDSTVRHVVENILFCFVLVRIKLSL